MSNALQLGTIPNPERLDEELQFFENEELALAHIVKHLLTDPERHVWRILLSDAVPANGKDAVRLQKRIKKDGQAAQDIYDAYRAEVTKSAFEARELGWVVTYQNRRYNGEREEIVAALGLSGVLVIGVTYQGKMRSGEKVNTAFIAGVTQSAEFEEPQQLRRKRRQDKSEPVSYRDAFQAYYRRVFKKAVGRVSRGPSKTSSLVEHRPDMYRRLHSVMAAHPAIREAGWRDACRRLNRRFDSAR